MTASVITTEIQRPLVETRIEQNRLVINVLTGTPTNTYLRRSANDWSGFDLKSAPVAADRVLIEDSEDSYKKKYAALISRLASGIAFTPAGDISSANVQAMGEELDAKKQPVKAPGDYGTVASGTVTFDARISNGKITTTGAQTWAVANLTTGKYCEWSVRLTVESGPYDITPTAGEVALDSPQVFLGITNGTYQVEAHTVDGVNTVYWISKISVP